MSRQHEIDLNLGRSGPGHIKIPRNLEREMRAIRGRYIEENKENPKPLEINLDTFANSLGDINSKSAEPAIIMEPIGVYDHKFSSLELGKPYKISEDGLVGRGNGHKKEDQDLGSTREIVVGEIQTLDDQEKEELSVPQEQKAFFTGLLLGNYDLSQRIKDGAIIVQTESRNPKTRNKLSATLGKWGEVSESERAQRITLPRHFDFLLNPRTDADFFDARRRYAPFLLGLMTGRLSEKEGRITMKNEKLMNSVHTWFQRHYGYELGSIRTEQRKPDGKPARTIEIDRQRLRKVYETLGNEDSIKKLPFLQELIEIESSNTTS